MFTFNGKEYRNLTEQVLQNKKLIENILEGAATIAEFGLKIINVTTDGTTPTEPPVLEEGDDNVFGYSWLSQNNVGELPVAFNLWTWTRLNLNTAAGWINLGEFPKRGPQGEKGEEGEKGEKGEEGEKGSRGNSVIIGDYNDLNSYKDANIGDSLIDRNTLVLRLKEATQWTIIGNIKGEQGAQGVPGKDGNSPVIINGNWYLNGNDTGIKAEGIDGQVLNLQTGTFRVDTLPNFNITSVGDAFVVTDDPTYTTAIYFNGRGGITWTKINWAVSKGEPGVDGLNALATNYTHAGGTVVGGNISPAKSTFNRTPIVGDIFIFVARNTVTQKTYICTAQVSSVSSNNVNSTVLAVNETTGIVPSLYRHYIMIDGAGVYMTTSIINKDASAIISFEALRVALGSGDPKYTIASGAYTSAGGITIARSIRGGAPGELIVQGVTTPAGNKNTTSIYNLETIVDNVYQLT